MKILHVYKTFGADAYGGVEKLIAQLASASAARGIRNEVLTVSARQKQQDKESSVQVGDCLVHRVARDMEIASTPIAHKLIGRLAQLAPQFDVVHYHFPWPWMDVAHFMGRVKTPTVLTYHSDIVRQSNWLRLYRPLKDYFLDDVDRIIATSPDYLVTSPILLCRRSKCEVIPIGLDRASYPPASQERLAKWRTKFGPGFFLFVGVLRYYKGLHNLVQAAVGTNYPIVIAGDGPFAAELREQAQRLGLSNIHFTGFVPEEDKIALLTLCCAFVFPSQLRAEAFGISLLEAAMFGKPMISCAIGTGTSYINRHGQTGLVVAPDNPQQLSEAMTTLWRNPQLCQQYGQQASARYTELFTASQMAERYQQTYQTVIDQTLSNRVRAGQRAK